MDQADPRLRRLRRSSLPWSCILCDNQPRRDHEPGKHDSLPGPGETRVTANRSQYEIGEACLNFLDAKAVCDAFTAIRPKLIQDHKLNTREGAPLSANSI